MFDEETLSKIKSEKEKWEEGPLTKAIQKFPILSDPPTQFFTPLDIKDYDFLKDVGFPGVYPFTAGTYPTEPLAGLSKFAAMAGMAGGGTSQLGGGGGRVRASLYSGYGAPEDTRDYYKQMQEQGVKEGPNLAFDLPTQCGYDSDNPIVEGEVGKVGVAVDTLRDFEVIYEPFRGEIDIDKIASNFTINAPAGFVLGIYFALAEKRGVAIERLRATPQNDILKEFVARGTYIFPPTPSMRLFRDTLMFLHKHTPRINITSIGGYHIREAGATREQDLSFSMAIAAEYLRVGVKEGLSVDDFAPRFTFNAFGGSIELFKEVAFQRAARRMYARMLKEKFDAKDTRSMLIRQPITAHTGPSAYTYQRPLNNLTRAVVGAIAGALSSGLPAVYPPYDEPLGLGWSSEARQLMDDARKILVCEAKLIDVTDPLAGSYYIESLTNEIEEAAWNEFNKIEDMGGAVAAIEKGYMQREVARSAYARHRRIEQGEDLMVGVNCFTGEEELEVTTNRIVPHPYDEEKRERAEELQIKNLKEVKKQRDEKHVSQLLKELKTAAMKDEENLMPYLINCASAYVTIQESCDVLREVFGEYRSEAIV